MTQEFVWRMEEVLELYLQPYDPQPPLVCMDERPCVLHAEVHPPTLPKPGQVARVDYEYARVGGCNLFMLFQPAQGWRHVTVTAQRSAADFAQVCRALVEDHFPHAQRIDVVLDNLNTHTPAALYQPFPAAYARDLVRKRVFHYTPKHASWLNMVELERSVLVRQCLQRRIASVSALRETVQAWQNTRNQQRATVHWHFGVEQARTKLNRLYPLPL